jgi:hypothetical protein
MNKMTTIKRLTICAACIALCYVLPLAFHSVGLGKVLSPLHLPVLLCGMVCGGGYGLFCGLAGPLLSSVLSGMPGPIGLITMVPELMTYGLMTGLAMKYIRTGRIITDLYISLILSMVIGRIVGGIAQLFAIYCVGIDSAFSIAIWINSYFIGTFPGILCQLILIPALVLTLEKAKVIPNRYHKVGVVYE